MKTALRCRSAAVGYSPPGRALTRSDLPEHERMCIARSTHVVLLLFDRWSVRNWSFPVGRRAEPESCGRRSWFRHASPQRAGSQVEFPCGSVLEANAYSIPGADVRCQDETLQVER